MNWKDKLRDLIRHPLAHPVMLTLLAILFTGGLFWWGSASVILTVDGTTRKIHRGKAKTVAEFLQQEKVTLHRLDLVDPPAATLLTHHMAVRITRITYRLESRLKKSRPKITWRVYLKANLRPVLIQRGHMDVESQKVKVILHDHVPVTEVVMKRRKRRRPVLTLTLFQRKTNLPRRTYNLLKCPHVDMLATAYYVGDPMVPSDTTYLGYKLRRGLVAVDPKVIPLRSRLYVKGYGYAYAADTGSKIKGNRIDLAVKDKYEEVRFNHKKVRVYVLEKANSW